MVEECAVNVGGSFHQVHDHEALSFCGSLKLCEILDAADFHGYLVSWVFGPGKRSWFSEVSLSLKAASPHQSTVHPLYSLVFVSNFLTPRRLGGIIFFSCGSTLSSLINSRMSPC